MINSNQSKSVQDYRPKDDKEDRKDEYRRFLFPYLILIGSQIPLCLVYLKGLWTERPHYGMLPVAIFVSGLFVFQRWPRHGEPAFFSSTKSDLLLATGVFLGVIGSLLLSPWFGFAAFLCLLGSLLARTNDRHVFGTLLVALVPMAVLLQPPVAIDFDTVQGDIQVMSAVNTSATQIASDILDLSQFPHNIADSRMEFPFGDLDSTALGNNTLSLFTLLIVTGLFIGFQRIPMFRGMMLLIAACFWAMTFEAFSLVICAIAETSFEKDFYSPGAASQTLQLVALFSAGGMTLLSERLIAFLFGPIDLQAVDENVSYQDMMCQLWNKAIAGISSPVIDVNLKREVAWARRRNSVPSQRVSTLIWSGGILLCALGILQLTGLASAWSRSGGSLFVGGNAIALNQESISETIAGFTRVDYSMTEPARKSVYDAYNHQWTFADQSGQEYKVLISQPFSGWHDIDREIRSQDWKPEFASELMEIQIGERTCLIWSASYRNNLAEYRTIFNFQIDGYGEEFKIPETWQNPKAFISRAVERLGNRNRPRVLSGRSMEINVFVDSVGPNSDAMVRQAEQLIRGVLQDVFSSIGNGTLGETTDQTD